MNFIFILLLFSSALIFLSLLFLISTTVNNAIALEEETITSVTGTYVGDDDKIYYVRQSGNEVWMVGLSNETKKVGDQPAFVNMFIGTIGGNNINGEWKELNIGSMDRALPLAGTLALRVEVNSLDEILSMQRTIETGGFTTLRWTPWTLYCAPEECLQ